ncbi:MAG: DNA polymerase III subunit delta [Muribaculaceae bacterium]|nr:DNA polymerase III subunit delta [Muribaculaceae bacterium]
MKFSDIPGQEQVKARLRSMVDSDRIPHAFVLEGPAGSGKFALARALAQYIHCTHRTPDGEPCGRCPACVQHQSFSHIDTLYSFPVIKNGRQTAISDDYLTEFKDFLGESPFMDFNLWLGKLGNINAQPHMYVEEGAELLRRLGFMTRSSRYKIVLMWLPERLNEETANKLLKLVEEPTGDTVFIMTSDNPRAILPTIYSRTQRIAVPRYSDADVALYLVGKGISPANAADAARVAQGNMNLALRLATGDEENATFFDLFVRLMRLAYARKVGELREWSVEVAGLGRETEIKFIDYCCRMTRESFITHLHVDTLLSMSDAENAFVQKFFPFINEKNVEDIVALFDRSRRDIIANANAKIVFFDVAVKIIMYIRRK